MNSKIKFGLHNADCTSFLETLPEGSIDLIIADPPYFQIVNEEWDNQWENESDYLMWCRKWASMSAYALKNSGCMYVWGTTKTNTFLRFKMEVMDAIPCPIGHQQMRYQNWLIWSYDWGGRTKKTWPRKHEDILMYSKGDYFMFNADAVRMPYKMKKNANASAQNNPLGKVPTDVWEKNNHTTSKEYCSWHPTQKPIELLERIILAHTREGDAVFDPFSGSGSTMIACERTGRRFIGCEIDAEYYERSLKRLEESKSW